MSKGTDMSKAVVAGSKPSLVSVEKDHVYFWCACGRSKKQPFCDGSHQGTDINPLAWRAPASGDVLMCTCKQSQQAPVCDGSHNGLSETYGESLDQASVSAQEIDFIRDDAGVERAHLDNGCYVIRHSDAALIKKEGLRLYPVVGLDDGANKLAQYAGTVNNDGSPVMIVGQSDTVIYVLAGQGRIHIAGREYAIQHACGIFVAKGETFQLLANPGDALYLNLTVCPGENEFGFVDEHQQYFNSVVQSRLCSVDNARRETMADRYFQVLVDNEQQGTDVTLFIGHIPQSRATHHRHLYEETLTVLSGHGYMWTDRTKTKIQPGDTIFLPRKQSHSVECLNTEGMLLVGAFYPSMSPAINY